MVLATTLAPITENIPPRIDVDLTEAPPGTRGVWSGGNEAPAPSEVEGSPEIFSSAIFMVGPVQSFPPHAGTIATPSPCITYWFGELPDYLEIVKDFSAAMFPHMAAFFQATENVFRVFIRKSIKGFGGTNFRASYMLEV